MKELESWINREINIIVEQIKKSSHYQKAKHEGYLNALKKVQNKIIQSKE